MTRALAVLTAIADGRAEATCSCEPSLRIDGLACCDQYLVHRLAASGLFRSVTQAPVGSWVRVELTAAGREALTEGLTV